MIPIGPDLARMIRQVIPWLALGHGVLHTALMLLFLYQGWLGHLIRRQRRTGAPAIPKVARRHRRNGPWLAALCLFGFNFGLFLVLLDRGRIGVYLPHLTFGLAIALATTSAYLTSRRIKSGDPAWRLPHRCLGICIVLLYPLQVMLGIGILL